MAIISNFPGGSVTGIKGDAETAYRTGNVNITPENIGTYSKEDIDSRLNTVILDHTIYLSNLFNVADHTLTFQPS